MPSKRASLCVNMDSEQRAEKIHDLEINYRTTRHRSDLLAKEEEARRLRLRSVLLRDENSSLKDQIAQRDERIKTLVELNDDLRGQLESVQQKCSRQEKLMQTQSREISNLKEELSMLSSVSQDSGKILSEKLVLSREVALLKPEIEHLRSQLSHQKDVLAEKLALERQLNALEVELANEKRAAQKAAQKQERDMNEEEDLRRQVRDLEKQLSKEKRALQKILQDKESGAELEQLREQLAAAETSLAAERRKAVHLAETQNSTPTEVEDELSRLRVKLANAEKELAAEKRCAKRKAETQQRDYDMVSKSEADEEAFEKLKAQLAETQKELKKSRAELVKAREQAVTIPSVKTTTVPLKKAAKAPAKKKRGAAEISTEVVGLQTPTDERPKRPIKKRGFEPSILGEKSTFSITPFLNKTVNLSDISPKPIGEDATRTLPVFQFRGPPAAAEDATTKVPMTADSEPTMTVPVSKLATVKTLEVKKPRGRPKAAAAAAPLVEASPNLTARNDRKAPRGSGSTLEKVTEEEPDNEAAPADGQENRSMESTGATKTSMIIGAGARSSAGSNTTTTNFSSVLSTIEPEPKKKKRKLLGGASSKPAPVGLFEEEDEGEKVAPLPVVKAAVMAKRPPKAGLKALGRVGGGVAGAVKNAFGGATFSPLKRDRREPLQIVPSWLSPQPQSRSFAAASRPPPATTRLRNSSQRQSGDAFAREARVQGLKSRAAFKLLEMDARYHLFKKASGQVVVDLGFAPGSWSQVALERTKPDGYVVGIDIIPAQPPRGVNTIQGNFLSPGVQGMVKQFLLEEEERRNKVKKASKRQAGEDGDEEVETQGSVVVTERPSYIDMERTAALESDMESGRLESTESEMATAATPADEKRLRLVDLVLSDMMMNTSGITFRDHAGSMDLCHAALSFASETLKSGGHFVCKFYQGSEDKAFENKLKKMFAKVHREKPESSRSESKESFFVALRRKPNVTLADIEK
ncbi:FtsJ-like methyltransferase-domain-containing protein [Apodospora peruviana]|uniref:rRNA methyltransferase 2, mitochondrial n=1 Tax=Apodospora peruviana TaxID=516989 RepID=A0AAE0I189_9PEZI|nr:FtsJ-like methyltransferase-domain-containing protein [Apodospora peruviana]